MKRSYAVRLVVMSALLSLAAFAQTRLEKDDVEFVRTAVGAGRAEVRLAQLADVQAFETSVKDVAKQLVKDHQAALDQLGSIVGRLGYTLPLEPSLAMGNEPSGGMPVTGAPLSAINVNANVQKKYDSAYLDLTRLSGSKFDKAWLSSVIDAHKKSIKVFERQSTSGRDGELKAFASDTLPTLKQHLGRLETLEKELKNRRF